jgi:hypothetical protein
MMVKIDGPGVGAPETREPVHPESTRPVLERALPLQIPKPRYQDSPTTRRLPITATGTPLSQLRWHQPTRSRRLHSPFAFFN